MVDVFVAGEGLPMFLYALASSVINALLVSAF